jgi:hypothetical protein
MLRREWEVWLWWYTILAQVVASNTTINVVAPGTPSGTPLTPYAIPAGIKNERLV